MIGKPLDNGDHSKVFRVKCKTTSKKYVLKLSEEIENLAHEIKILKKISKAKIEDAGLPQLVDSGLVHLTNMAQRDIDSCKKITD